MANFQLAAFRWPNGPSPQTHASEIDLAIQFPFNSFNSFNRDFGSFCRFCSILRPKRKFVTFPPFFFCKGLE
jgi:hypothetical protein